MTSILVITNPDNGDYAVIDWTPDGDELAGHGMDDSSAIYICPVEYGWGSSCAQPGDFGVLQQFQGQILYSRFTPGQAVQAFGVVGGSGVAVGNVANWPGGSTPVDPPAPGPGMESNELNVPSSDGGGPGTPGSLDSVVLTWDETNTRLALAWHGGAAVVSVQVEACDLTISPGKQYQEWNLAPSPDSVLYFPLGENVAGTSVAVIRGHRYIFRLTPHTS